VDSGAGERVVDADRRPAGWAGGQQGVEAACGWGAEVERDACILFWLARVT